MTVYVYSHDDAGAPVLTGEAGSLIALLDACLINGYGSKTPPPGWTKPYSGTNKAVYRLDPTNFSGRYLRVQDDGTLVSSNSQFAGVTGYHTMTDVDTGTGPFPSANVYFRKSTANTSASRQWVMYADEGFFWLFLRFAHNTGDNREGFWAHCFGDISPGYDNPGEVTLLSGNTNTNLSGFYPSSTQAFMNLNTASIPCAGVMPAADGTIATTNARFSASQFNNTLGQGLFTNAGEDNGAGQRISPIFLSAGNWFCGRIPGLFAPWTTTTDAIQGQDFNDFIGDGRTFRAQRIHVAAGGDTSRFCTFMDITGPWR